MMVNKAVITMPIKFTMTPGCIMSITCGQIAQSSRYVNIVWPRHVNVPTETLINYNNVLYQVHCIDALKYMYNVIVLRPTLPRAVQCSAVQCSAVQPTFIRLIHRGRVYQGRDVKRGHWTKLTPE